MLNALKMAAFAAVVSVFSVQAATITGTVRAANSGPGQGTVIQGAKVVLVRFNGGGGGQGTRVDSATTNAQGVYTLDSVAAGNYSVQASMTGFNNAQSFTQAPNGNQSVTVNFTLTRVATPATGT